MHELFLFSFSDIVFDLGRVGIFILIASLILICTLPCLCLSIFKSRYSIKKRVWLFFCYAGLVAFEWWAESIIKENYSFVFLTISGCFIFCALIIIIPEKPIKIRKEQLELAKFFDNQANSINDKTTNKQDLSIDQKEISNCQSLLNKVERKKDICSIKTQIIEDDKFNQSQEIDFLNVKTILNKLGYYSISNQDKSIAKELEKAIISAEKYGLDDNLKRKINDGLGALLKIMSKYAI